MLLECLQCSRWSAGDICEDVVFVSLCPQVTKDDLEVEFVRKFNSSPAAQVGWGSALGGADLSLVCQGHTQHNHAVCRHAHPAALRPSFQHHSRLRLSRRRRRGGSSNRSGWTNTPAWTP